MTNQSDQGYNSNTSYMSGDANTRGNDRNSRRDTGFGDLVGSMLGFAGASTRFAIQQMENAFVAITQPQKVMNRVRHSLDNISHAMTDSGEEGGRRRESFQGSQPFQGSQRRSDPVSAAAAMDPTGTAQQSQINEEDVMTGRKR